MTEQPPQPSHRRLPLLAGILSLLAPGLGQVYCGRIVRGLVLATIVLTATPLYLLILTRLSQPTTSALLAVFRGYLLTCLVPLVDAVYLARRTRSDYQLKEYNRPVVYVLLWWVLSGASLGYALYARSRHVEAFRVPVASMYPTIVPNDRFLANKTAYRKTDPARGDVVVFTPVTRRHEKWIKRVVALAGDTVEVREGQVFVNDQPLTRTELPNRILSTIPVRHAQGPDKGQFIDGKVYEENNGHISYTILLSETNGATQADFPKTTIPPHHCFVLGDNRDNSHDSRHIGPIPLATIIGRADYLYCPAKDWSRFGPLTVEPRE